MARFAYTSLFQTPNSATVARIDSSFVTVLWLKQTLLVAISCASASPTDNAVTASEPRRVADTLLGISPTCIPPLFLMCEEVRWAVIRDRIARELIVIYGELLLLCIGTVSGGTNACQRDVD